MGFLLTGVMSRLRPASPAARPPKRFPGSSAEISPPLNPGHDPAGQSLHSGAAGLVLIVWPQGSGAMQPDLADAPQAAPAAAPELRPLGQMLLAGGLIGESDLERGLAFQARFGGRLGAVLVRIGALSEAGLLSVLSEQLRLPVLAAAAMPAEAAPILAALERSGLPPEWWLDQEALAWEQDGIILCVARDPVSPFLGEAVECAFAGEGAVQWRLILNQDLDRLLDLVERALGEDRRDVLDEVLHLRELAEEAPVVELVSNTLSQALGERASTSTSSRRSGNSASATASTGYCTRAFPCRANASMRSPRGSSCCRAWTSPSAACRRTAASASASTARRSISASRPCPGPGASRWCCGCCPRSASSSRSKSSAWSPTTAGASAPRSPSRTAFCWSPGRPARANRRPSTPRSKRSPTAPRRSSPSRTRSNTTSPGSTRSRSTPISATPLPARCARFCGRTRTSS